MRSDETLTWRGGQGPPLLLLHSVLTTWRMWRPLLDDLSRDHEVLAVTMAGHGGRSWPEMAPRTIEHVIDDVEGQLGRAGWAKAHLVGNSLGGLVAMELGRRGRALSVTTFAPGGGGPVPDRRVPRIVRAMWWQTKLARPLMPVTMRPAPLRRAALRLTMEHGDRLTLPECLEMADELLAVDASAVRAMIDDVAGRPIEPFADPRCPCHVAWPEHDRDTPADPYAAGWVGLAPHATTSVVRGAGHIPVVDAPTEVVETIRRIVRSAGASGH